MEPRNGNALEINPEKAFKTAVLVGAINLLVSPGFMISKSAGLLLMIAANVFSIFQFHALGKERRPGSNLLTRGITMFSSRLPSGGELVQTRVISNAVKNIVEGGSAIVDELAAIANRSSNSRPRR